MMKGKSQKKEKPKTKKRANHCAPFCCNSDMNRQLSTMHHTDENRRSRYNLNQCAAVEPLAGAIALPLFIGAMAEPAPAGDMAELLIAGAVVAAGIGAGAGAGVVAAAGGGVVAAVSSSLWQALRASTAASEKVHIKVWRIIFIGQSPGSGLGGNFQHLSGFDPIRVGELIAIGIKNQHTCICVCIELRGDRR
jgi:hypothetical protein